MFYLLNCLLDILNDVVDKLAKDALKPHISKVLGFNDNIDAFEKLDSTLLGKVLVEIGDS
jgi:NADPH:quinone reductase-like Zn-dependent oxidoreductase